MTTLRAGQGQAACFVTGLAALLVEMTAFRLLAPAFGSSSHVTGIVINTILLGLAVGYALGGQAGDRMASSRLPYSLVLACAADLLAVYFGYTHLLRVLTTLPLLLGAAAAACLMFMPPMILLGFVPPYLVRHLSRQETLGRTAGRLYSLSTLGSICGGLGATFLLLPSLGSRRTLLFAIALLLAQGAVGLTRRAWTALPAAMLALPLALVPPPRTGALLHEEESEYNLITITESDGRRYLRLNGGFGHHSQSLDPVTWMSGDYYDALLFAQLLTDARDTLILGNGAGTSLMQTAHFFASRIDGVELDPRLSALGRSYFGLRLDARVRLFHEDARVFLGHAPRSYDVVYVDVYAGSPYVPFHVATREFYAELSRALRPGAVVAVNLPFFAVGTELNARFLSTIRSVFASTYIFENVVYAFSSPITTTEIDERLAARALPPALLDLAERIRSSLRPAEGGGADPFTDDNAPVERLTYAALASRWR